MEQLNALSAYYNTRKPPTGTLVLVNYMPVVRFMEQYVEIPASEAERLQEEGYPPPVSMKHAKKGEGFTAVPYIPPMPGYAYYSNMPLGIKGKDVAFAIIKRSPWANEQPFLIKVQDKYYKNPNIIPLHTLITDAYNNSMIGKYIHPGQQEWNAVPLSTTIPEMRCYNYTTTAFTDMINLRNAANAYRLDAEHEKIVNTYMLIAQTELGHYFSTYRKRSSNTGTLAYCYNSEFVPIYYGFGMSTVLNDTVSREERLADVLADTLKPADDVLQRYVAIPKCCQNIITRDDKVYRDINGNDLSSYTTSAVLYLTRQDVALLSKWYSTPAKEGVHEKDTYSYRNVMPYLFNGLLEGYVAMGHTVPDYYKPQQWVVKVCVGKSNTGREGKYIAFDIKTTAPAEGAFIEHTLSYPQFATLQFHNVVNPTDNTYNYEAYIDPAKQTFSMMPTVSLDNITKNLVLDNYVAFLDRFFTKVGGTVNG